jgi:CheY-like chemotaxis protein
MLVLVRERFQLTSTSSEPRSYATALPAGTELPPDLVLADVMMPRRFSDRAR